MYKIGLVEVSKIAHKSSSDHILSPSHNRETEEWCIIMLVLYIVEIQFSSHIVTQLGLIICWVVMCDFLSLMSWQRSALAWRNSGQQGEPCV